MNNSLITRRSLGLLSLLLTGALAARAQNIGVGTLTPSEKLDVVGGNLKISTAGSTLIFPDGSTQSTAASGTSGTGFILNTPASQQTGSFNLSGTGTLGGALQAGTNLGVDRAGANAGTLTNALRFGAAGTGEGIASKRTTGGNQFGLDFYTNNAARLSISGSGNVGIGTSSSTNGLVVGSTQTTSVPVDQQHNLQLEVRQGTGSKALTLGVLPSGTGMIQAKENGVGYSPLLLNPVSGSVGIGTGSAAPRGQFDVAGTGDTYLTSNTNNSGTQSLFLPGHVFLAPYGGGSQSFIMARSNVAGGNQGFVFRTNLNGNYHDALTLNPDGGAVFSSPNAAPYLMQSTAADVNGVLDLRVPNNPSCPTCNEVVFFRKTDGTQLGSIGSNTNTNSVTYGTTSDRRLKENVRATRFGLADLLKLEVKDYNFIGAPAAARTTGFLAQDLHRIYPDAVKPGDTGATVTNAWGVDYGKLTPLLVQAIQDQQKLIEKQQAELNALKTQNAALQTGSDADHASLLTLQAQMARLLGEAAPAGAQARK